MGLMNGSVGFWATALRHTAGALSCTVRGNGGVRGKHFHKTVAKPVTAAGDVGWKVSCRMCITEHALEVAKRVKLCAYSRTVCREAIDVLRQAIGGE